MSRPSRSWNGRRRSDRSRRSHPRRANVERRYAALILVLSLAAPWRARAQDVPRYSTLEVELESGTKIRGRALGSGADGVSLLRRGDSIAIRRDSIATIRRRDPNMRGGVLSGLVVGSIGGAVFGALLGQALCEYDCDNEWVGGAAIGALFGAGVGVGAGYTAGMVFPRWRSVGANAVVVPPRASRFLPTDRCDGGDALFRVEGGVSTWGLSTARGELGVLCEPGTVAGFEGGFMDVFDVHTEQLVNDARGNYTREVDIVRTTKYIGVVADRSFSFLPPWMRVVTAVGAYRTTEESSSIDRDSSGQIIDPGSRSFVATNRDFAAGFGIGLSTQLVRKGPWAATAEARTHLFRGFTTSALTLGASYRPR